MAAELWPPRSWLPRQKTASGCGNCEPRQVVGVAGPSRAADACRNRSPEERGSGATASSPRTRAIQGRTGPCAAALATAELPVSLRQFSTLPPRVGGGHACRQQNTGGNRIMRKELPVISPDHETRKRPMLF